MVTFCTLILIALAGFVQAAPKSPFGAAASFAPTEGALVLRVELTGPARGHFNAGFLKLALPEGYAAEAIEPPPPVPDELFEDGVYPAGTILYYRVSPAEPIPQMTLEIQGCVDDMCYMPQKIVLNETLVQETPPADAPAPENWYQGFAREEVTFGYSKAEEFASWLERAQAAGEESPQETNLLARVAGKYGLWLAALLVIPLGMLLNLTPCVLPMIPVTLAVLGASGAGDRRRGFLLGMAYGLAMAVAYGLAGAIFVKVGGRFGGINASPWFNWAAGIVMVCLGLSMFGLFCLDLSRFRKLPDGSRGGYGSAVFLGATAALLAGACVAPVLIWVLVFATGLYSGGNALGLWLPFLLGTGLGLPWPFLGAGLGFLPKPGGWMTRVKQAFGVMILLFACQCFWNGFQLTRNQKVVMEDDGYWLTDAAAAAAEARSLGRPLFIDFWGVTCKACTTMDATTLRNPEVRRRLDRMTRLKLQADDFENPALKPVLEHFQIVGLPAYVLLIP